MAHIADLMVEVPDSVGLNNYIARELSPSPPVQNVTPSDAPNMDDKKEYVWRMHQPTETTAARKYQLFPAKDKLSIAKNSDAEPSSSNVVGQGTTEKDRSILGSALRLKHKEQNLIRRRKVSVTELGPMTTVQEVAMDSPTIPGRPPLHERSISAPGNSWRQHIFADSILSCIPGPALDENSETAVSTVSFYNQGLANIGPLHLPSPLSIEQPFLAASSRSDVSKHPLSPRMLAPLVIPQSSLSQPFQRLNRSPSKTRLRDGSAPTDGNPPEVPPKSARMMEASPLSRASPFTPMSAASTILSASTAPTSVTSTPNGEGRSSPKPWNTAPGRSSPKPWIATGRSSPKPLPSVNSSSAPNPSMMLQKNNSDYNLSANTLRHQHSFPLAPPQTLGHRRHESESAASTTSQTGSIMDRGRPKKRCDGSPMKRPLKRSPSNPTPPTQLPSSHSPARSIIPSGAPIQTPKSTEQKAFEHLPSGHPSLSAHTHLPASELSSLRAQALSQAHRFHVLSTKDVDSLSRELRALDERCEYLRKTHRSLRSGRRNLHERICNYLRSPRTARFSGDAMLKQEEALRELDGCIDDWVCKLEFAENRRTRVRQKLLEHVAAALIVETGCGSPQAHEHIVNSMVGQGQDTPPRSPTKLGMSQSPERERVERLSSVVEEVPFSFRTSTPVSADQTPTSSTATWVNTTTPQVQETTPEPTNRPPRREILSHMSSASVKIYADSDVYALMDCVEEEINLLQNQQEADSRAQYEERKREEDNARETERRATKERERKKEDTIMAGITLNAVTFEGMGAHSRRGSPARAGAF